MKKFIAIIGVLGIVSLANAQHDIGGSGSDLLDTAMGGSATANIDMKGFLVTDSTDALELGTACTGGATGAVCMGGDLHAEGDITVTGQASYTVYAPACATGTDDFAIDWANGNIAHLDLEGCDQDANDVNAPTNATNYTSYIITIEQSTAGTEDLTWNAAFLFSGGTDPVNTQTNNARDVISCLYVDSVYHCGSVLDLQ